MKTTFDILLESAKKAPNWVKGKRIDEITTTAINLNRITHKQALEIGSALILNKSIWINFS